MVVGIDVKWLVFIGVLGVVLVVYVGDGDLVVG